MNKPLEDTTNKKHRSRGYCFSHNSMWFASLAELTFYITLLSRGKTFTFQPFTFNRKRPDFLSESVVYEIKYGLKAKDRKKYILWSMEMTKKLGYKYIIVDYKDKDLQEQYIKVSELVKSKYKIRRGRTRPLSDEIINELVSLFS